MTPVINIQGFIDGLRPEPRLTVSEWSDMFRMLDSKTSAEPGAYKTSRTPYLKEIMDNLSPYSPIEKIVFMKAAQIGATEVGNNWVGFCIDNAPGPFLLVQPTDEMAKRNSKTRIAPLIESTPKLKDKVKESRSRDSGNTILQKEFPGGVLVMTGANSAVGLRSLPARFVFLDEVDAYPPDVDGEGNPIDLAIKRTTTFSNRKIYIVSTPTVQGYSVVEKEFAQTDQRYFHIPCPHCGLMQPLVFSQLKWEKGKPENVIYECVSCSKAIEERFKPTLLNQGQWIATNAEYKNSKKVGYHLSALYSPWGWKYWASIAEEYEAAEGDEPKMKTFVNTVLGETYKEKTEAPEWERISERAVDYPDNVPFDDVVIITAGADVQADRIEVDIVGWCKGKISQQIDYRVLLGDTTKPQVWEQLSDLLSEQFIKKDNTYLTIKLMALDSGYNTSKVYEFCSKHGTNRVIPIKGKENLEMIFSPPKAVQVTKAGQKLNKVKVWGVGTSYIKAEVYGWLRQTIDPDTQEVPNGYCYFRKRDPNYFRGLVSEVVVVIKNTKGYLQHVWKKKYDRNEPLDCRVYARAAASVVGVDRMTEKIWQDQLIKLPKIEFEKPIAVKKAKPKNTNKPNFLNHIKKPF